ncbi:DegT/DnrJ/EryC1/StrS family aminotransferase, partial [bacterium]
MRSSLNSILPAPEPVLNLQGRVIPVSEPLLNGNEIKYLTDCIKTGWISSLGGYVERFERGFGRFCRAKYAVSVSSGTAALHLALASLGIGKGDEVILPAFTMVSTPNAVMYQGAKPVLVDSEDKAFGIDPAKIEEKITKRTKAIIVVHIYGHPARMDEILKIARKHKLYVIEDAAEAHGAEYKGKRVGSIGDVGCFSFYGNKIIATGEGGMLVTSNRKIKDKAEYLRDLAFSKERHFWHKELGFNYRMSNLQAAVGLAQLERIRYLINIKRKNALLYKKFLSDIPGIILPPEEKYAKNVFWMYAVLVNKDFGITRDELRVKLARKGIDTRIF